jgi:hypothetical protein
MCLLVVYGTTVHQLHDLNTVKLQIILLQIISFEGNGRKQYSVLSQHLPRKTDKYDLWAENRTWYVANTNPRVVSEQVTFGRTLHMLVIHLCRHFRSGK